MLVELQNRTFKFKQP